MHGLTSTPPVVASVTNATNLVSALFVFDYGITDCSTSPNHGRSFPAGCALLLVLAGYAVVQIEESGRWVLHFRVFGVTHDLKVSVGLAASPSVGSRSSLR